jgi:hypothetical protein
MLGLGIDDLEVRAIAKLGRPQRLADERRFGRGKADRRTARGRYTSLLHQDGERRRQSRNAKTRNGLNETYVTPRQPVPGTKGSCDGPARCFATPFPG